MTTATEVKPDNIESLDAERLWQDGLKAIDEQYEEAEQSRQRWLRIGKGLLIGRVRCPHNIEFGKWVDGTGYHVLNSTDRKAAMWLAINADVLMPALSETRISAPEAIRDHVRQKMRPIYVLCKDIMDYVLDMSEDMPSAKEAKPAPNVGALPTKQNPRSSFSGLPRGDEVHALFASPRSRVVIAKACKKGAAGKEIYDLILTAIDHGFLMPVKGSIQAMTLRVLFPEAPRDWRDKFHLTHTKDREYIRDVIMPAAIANRDAILKRPKAIDTIIAEHVRTNQIAVQKQEAQKKVVELVKALPSNEKQIIAYGKQMWPVVNATYDYDQVRAAVWTFQDLSRWISQTLSGHNSPGSVAQIIRLSTKWMQEYLNRASEQLRTRISAIPDADRKAQAEWITIAGEGGSRIRKIYVLIGELSRALENNPSGECRFPPPPHIEGQW